MATFSTFEEIDAWKKSRQFSKKVFELTTNGPFARDFGLRDQINRSTGSIMDNIAEGFERGGRREFIQALSISKGSTGESRSQLYRALDRNYITAQVFETLNNEGLAIGKMIWALMDYLRKSEIQGPKFDRKR